MKKQIVSETKQYQPSFPDELLLDDTPKVNSFNGVTSDGVARAIAGASGEVPQVTESDNGKVLTAIYDEGGAAVEWGEAASGLPESSSADEGKVLTVDANGDPEWAEAQSGASYTAGNGIAISGQNVISSDTASSDFVYGQTSAIPSSNYNNNNSFWYPEDGDGRSAPSTIKCIRAIEIGFENYTLHWVTGTAGQAYVSTFSVDVRYGVTVGTILQLPKNTRSSDWVGGVTPIGVSPIYLTIAGSTGGTAPNGEEVVALRADASTPYFVAVENPTTMYLKNPLPASAVGDAGKILTVNAQGAPAWGMLGSVKSIQQVSELPASPDANTLYLIPEA